MGAISTIFKRERRERQYYHLKGQNIPVYFPKTGRQYFHYYELECSKCEQTILYRSRFSYSLVQWMDPLFSTNLHVLGQNLQILDVFLPFQCTLRFPKSMLFAYFITLDFLHDHKEGGIWVYGRCKFTQAIRGDICTPKRAIEPQKKYVVVVISLVFEIDACSWA